LLITDTHIYIYHSAWMKIVLYSLASQLVLYRASVDLALSDVVSSYFV
jgi:hypothetical protein